MDYQSRGDCPDLDIPRIQGTDNISETPYVVSLSHVTIEKRGKFRCLPGVISSGSLVLAMVQSISVRQMKREDQLWVISACFGCRKSQIRSKRRPNGSGNQWELCPDRDDRRESKRSNGNSVPNWTKVMERNGYGVRAGSDFGIHLEWCASSNREQHCLETLGSVGLAEGIRFEYNNATIVFGACGFGKATIEANDRSVQTGYSLWLLETFVMALLFATGCAEPSFVQLPINVPGIPSGLHSAHHVVRGHDLRSKTFLVLFNDQNHTKTPGSIVDSVTARSLKYNSETLNQKIWGGENVSMSSIGSDLLGRPFQLKH
ncbi:hypothetical protein B0H13DRAFT_1886551 [Mycena leptocephala]|nr:hypothetical protein B0H13DRAFT_1886551 [Mycena leptocephala]